MGEVAVRAGVNVETFRRGLSRPVRAMKRSVVAAVRTRECPLIEAMEETA
jgi:hypothetical protein